MKHETNQKAEHYVVELYRKLHLIPEKAFQEFETAKLVAAEMVRLGLEVKTGIAGTGVIGTLTAENPDPQETNVPDVCPAVRWHRWPDAENLCLQTPVDYQKHPILFRPRAWKVFL